MSLWTVAKFPDGSWSTDGKPDDPAYAECQVFTIWAEDRKQAKRKAQYQARKRSKKP